MPCCCRRSWRSAGPICCASSPRKCPPKSAPTGKTSSSPHDDSAVAAVGLCLDARPVVLVGALRPLQPPLPDGLQGSVLLRGIDAYLKELARLQRRPSSAALPPWADPQPAIAAEATQ